MERSFRSLKLAAGILIASAAVALEGGTEVTHAADQPQPSVTPLAESCQKGASFQNEQVLFQDAVIPQPMSSKLSTKKELRV